VVTVKRHKQGRRRTSLLLTLLAALVLPLAAVNVASPPQASATGGWPQTLSDVYAIDVATHPDGSVSVFSCGNGSNGAQSFDTDGNVTTTASQDYVFCDGWEGVAGADGTIFGTKYSTSGQVDIVAFQDDDELWTPVELTACTNEWASSAGMVIGADGDLYVVVYAPNCSNQYYLLGIDADDGSTKFKETLGTAAAANPSNRNGYVAAHDGGLVVRHGNSTFRYFNYSGVEDTGKAHTVSLAGSEHVDRWAVNTDGTLFAMVIDTNWSRSGACTEPVILNRVYRRSLAGSGHDYELDDACTYAHYIHVTPSGGAVVPREMNYQISGSYDTDTTLLLLQSDNSIVDVVVPGLDGYNVMTEGNGTTSLLVDMAGNLVHTRRVVAPSWPYEKFVQVTFLDSDGTRLATSYDTTGFDQEYYSDSHYVVSGGVALSNGYVYLTVCQYANCSSADTQMFRRVPFAEIGFEYPMGALLDLTAPQSALDLVVMGDSFSSGEGVPPFDPDTNDDNVNECHRSEEKAYAKHLDLEPSISLQLQAFVACSGARTVDITATQQNPGIGQWNETAQKNYLSTSTNVVTITIGGNDVDFQSFARACTIGSCDTNSTAYSTITGKIQDELLDEEKLKTTYEAILGASGSANLYVLGYPHLAPDAVPLDECWPLTPATSYNPLTDGTDIPAVRAVVNALNNAISQAVTDVKNGGAYPSSRTHYVDVNGTGSPFAGRDLCSPDPYFNSLYWPIDQSYSFHPNEDGQDAYGEVARDYYVAN
jgi:hypothetical protein